MTDLITARELVRDYLRGSGERMGSFGSALPGHQNHPRHELVIVKELEYDFGWVFFWNTKRFMESGDHRHGLVGNAPLIVDRNDGKLYITGTAHRLDYYIEEYRKGKRPLSPLVSIEPSELVHPVAPPGLGPRLHP